MVAPFRPEIPRMTNRIALGLALVIAAALAGDLLGNDLRGSLFLARKLFVFLDYIAFWR